VDQVAVGGVDLDHAKAGCEGAPGGGHERLDGVGNVARRHVARLRVGVRELDRARRDHIGPAAFAGWDRAISAPRAVGARLPARVRELHARYTALPVREVDDARQHVDVVVLPDPEIFRADAPFRRDRGGLGEDQAGTADRTAAEMHEVPVVGETVDARVLAHGRHEHAVGEGQVANRQGIEEMRHLLLS
jgi:hypothetical protein